MFPAQTGSQEKDKHPLHQVRRFGDMVPELLKTNLR